MAQSSPVSPDLQTGGGDLNTEGNLFLLGLFPQLLDHGFNQLGQVEGLQFKPVLCCTETFQPQSIVDCCQKLAGFPFCALKKPVLFSGSVGCIPT